MLTKYGMPQVAIYPALLAISMTVLAVCFYPAVWIWFIELLLLAVLVWVLSFFRNPIRRTPKDESILYAPCDGTVTEISSDDGRICVGMFLSIYNVHINRAPCTAEVIETRYMKGQHRSAHDGISSKVNESNDITFRRSFPPGETVTVRQISGAVARHIVCAVKVGDRLKQGEQLGMIKFGSRTELIIPGSSGYILCVQPGDKVKAGLTPLIRYTEAAETV